MACQWGKRKLKTTGDVFFYNFYFSFPFSKENPVAVLVWKKCDKSAEKSEQKA